MGAIKNYFSEEINSQEFDDVFSMEEPLSSEEIDEMLCDEFDRLCEIESNSELPQFINEKY